MDTLLTIAQQGGGFNFGGLLQILVLLLAFGGPLLGWIVKKVKEQAELKAARDRQREMERETLRTTQVVQRESPSSERSVAEERQEAMRDLAMRRQAQLQELRQRQIEAARQRQAGQSQQPSREDDIGALTGIPGTAAPQVRATPSPSGGQGIGGGSGVTPLVPGSARQRQAGGQQALRPPPVVAPPPRRRQPQAPARTEPAKAAPARPKKKEQAPPNPVEARRQGGRLGVRAMFFDDHNKPRSKHDLRRAFALSEIFGKPISMREEGGGIGNG